MAGEEIDLTQSEKRSIAALKRVAKAWPSTLWLFSAGPGPLAVMRKDKDGNKVHVGTSIDQYYIVDQIDIESDGGDW